MKSNNICIRILFFILFIQFQFQFRSSVSLIKSNYRKRDISNSTNNSTNSSNNELDLIVDEDLTDRKKKIWDELFDTTYSESCVGYQVQIKRVPISTNLTDRLPVKRDKSIYEKNYGFGPVAYLFDYLDLIMSSTMSKLFLQVWNDAIKIKKDINFITNNTSVKISDPYDLSTILTIHNMILTNMNITLNASLMTDQEINLRMKKLTDEFDLDTYKNSLTIPVIRVILMKWGWNKKWDKPDVAKYLVDNYDMDGDGRLNLREFILMSIINNELIFGTHDCKNCYKHVIDTKIDPFYDFMDCQGKDLISTTDICTGLKNMKRNQIDTFNMFKCTYDNLLYHSSSCNDLILKNHKSQNGVLTKSEFRKGILLGYWDRLTNKTMVLSNDEKTQKETRWLDSGKTDISCNKISEFKY